MTAIEIRGQLLATPPDVDRAERNRYRSICKYHAAAGNAVPCWGLWQHTRTLKRDNLQGHRWRRPIQYPDVHPKVRRAWWEFKRRNGDCDVYAFESWYFGKGPLPSPVL